MLSVCVCVCVCVCMCVCVCVCVCVQSFETLHLPIVFVTGLFSWWASIPWFPDISLGGIIE